MKRYEPSGYPSGLTCTQVALLLSYFAGIEPEEVTDVHTRTRDDARNLYDDNYLEPAREAPTPRLYKLTERGRVFCEALMQTPAPRQTWTCEPSQ